MSSLMSPRDALSKIPEWDAGDVDLRELKGGLTNRSYLVERQDESFVLRLDAAHTDVFNLNRASEMSILHEAAAAGLAPELVFADVATGILLSRYLPGRVWNVADLDDDDNIDALAELLRKVHALPASGQRFDPVGVARQYVGNLANCPGLHGFALRCEQIIDDLAMTDTSVCCHNDVVAGNIISDRSLKLLDWEYACDNDPMFDLASLIAYHNLKEDRRAALLGAYAGNHDSGLKERLEIQIRLYDAIQWLWLANRHVITSTPEQTARLEELRQRIV